MIEAIVAAVAVLGGIGGLLTLFARFRDSRWLSWLFRRLAVEPIDELLEKRIDEQIRPMARKVDAIYYEMHPNSGYAMRDVVDRTERVIREVQEDLGTQGERLARVEGQVDVLTRKV